MSIKSVLKSAVVAWVTVASGSLFAQGTPINAAAYDALVAQGPVASAATVASSTWASKIKQAGTLRLGGTQTSNLFSLLNEKDGKMRGFDAGLAQLLARYILGDGAKTQFTQVTSSTREQVLINDQVDLVLATYSITPARAEKISFAGPYYTSQAAVLVKGSNKAIQSYNDLAGKKVATQAGSTGPAILAQHAPKAVVQEFQTHQEALDALKDSELSRARAVWSRRYASAPSDLNERARQTRFLLARGFSSTIVRQVLQAAAHAEIDDTEAQDRPD